MSNRIMGAGQGGGSGLGWACWPEGAGGSSHSVWQSGTGLGMWQGGAVGSALACVTGLVVPGGVQLVQGWAPGWVLGSGAGTGTGGHSGGGGAERVGCGRCCGMSNRISCYLVRCSWWRACPSCSIRLRTSAWDWLASLWAASNRCRQPISS